VARFLAEEAESLDAGDYDAWLALFSDSLRRCPRSSVVTVLRLDPVIQTAGEIGLL
jgi:hypothetical protein